VHFPAKYVPIGVAYTKRNLEPVDTAAALGSGSAPLPSLPQPWARVLPLVLGSAASPFDAIHPPSGGPPKAEDLRPDPLTGKMVEHGVVEKAGSAVLAMRTHAKTALQKGLETDMGKKGLELKLKMGGMPSP